MKKMWEYQPILNYKPGLFILQIVYLYTSFLNCFVKKSIKYLLVIGNVALFL